MSMVFQRSKGLWDQVEWSLGGGTFTVSQREEYLDFIN